MIYKLSFSLAIFGLSLLTNQQEEKGSIYLQAWLTRFPWEGGLLLPNTAMFRMQGIYWRAPESVLAQQSSMPSLSLSWSVYVPRIPVLSLEILICVEFIKRHACSQLLLTLASGGSWGVMGEIKGNVIRIFIILDSSLWGGFRMALSLDLKESWLLARWTVHMTTLPKFWRLPFPHLVRLRASHSSFTSSVS